jgi:hypothetical protein
MKRTNDDIEGPVSKSPWLLVGGVFVLMLLISLGVLLLIEAFKQPEGPQDVLDMKRMLASGVGVILFSMAVFFFLLRMFRKSVRKPAKKKPAKRRAPARKK